MNLLLKRETNYPAVEKLFLAAWTVFAIRWVCFVYSELPHVFPAFKTSSSYLFYASLALLASAFLFVGKMTWKKFASLAAFMALVMVIELQHMDGMLLIMAMFMAAAQFVDMKRFMRYDVLLKAGLFLTVVLLHAAGVLPETGLRNKHALGFVHPNVVATLFLTILAQWLCIRFHGMKTWEWAAVLLLSIGGLYVFGGRTTGYTFLVIYALFVIAKRYPSIMYSKISQIAFAVVTPLMAAASYLTGILYRQGNALMIALDKVLSTRLYWVDRFMRDYDIRLFGQEVLIRGAQEAELTGLEHLPLDNAYIRGMLMYGAVFLVVLCAVYALIFRKLLRKRHVEWALLGLFFVLIGFGEAYMLDVFINVSLLYFLGAGNIEPEWKTTAQ